MGTPCFWMDRLGVGEVALRRYHSSGDSKWTCAEGWHNAESWIGVRVDYDLRPNERFGGAWSFPLATDVFAEPAHDDPRWPARCQCGYVFAVDDNWQVFVEEVYRRVDTGGERTLHWNMNPPGVPRAEWGALWDAPWQNNTSMGNLSKPDDGIWLMARCPSISDKYGNDWAVDMPATSGGYWARVGDPRNPSTLTVSPSIQTGDYHGFLQAGVFTDHVG